MERVRTGLAEFDQMLGGGFMPGDAVLVAGSAGTGKSTLGLQYLVNGITKFGEPGIYVTFEELPDQIYRDAANFGWDLKKLERENKLRVLCTSPNLLLQTGGDGGILKEPLKEVNPRRIVIDSLNHLAMYLDERDLRKESYRLLMYLKARNLSSLSLWENPQIMGESLSITEMGLSFLVDCVIMLRLVEIESSLRKAAVVLKMRGSDHDKRLREFQITSEGIKMLSPFTEFEGVITGAPRRIASERFVDLFREATKKKK